MAKASTSFDDIANDPAVNEDAGNVRADLTQLREDLARLSETVTSLLTSQAGSARESVRAAATDYYDQGRDALRQVEDQAREYTDELSRTIERNPITAVMTALGVGFVLGLLNRGR